MKTTFWKSKIIKNINKYYNNNIQNIKMTKVHDKMTKT